MKRLIYISTAIDTIQEIDIDDIVATAQRVNEVQSLTGVLLFNGLNFLQLLEGPQSNVENIYNRILTDKRHVSVTTVLVEPAQLRIFSDWRMVARKTPELQSKEKFKKMHVMTDVLDREMPVSVRKVFDNFASLKGI